MIEHLRFCEDIIHYHLLATASKFHKDMGTRSIASPHEKPQGVNQLGPIEEPKSRAKVKNK